MQKLKSSTDLSRTLMRGERALIIVAHPDDETIWMNGFILKHPQIDWTIFSLCRASDPDRAPKFKRVCKHYGAKAIITDLEDDDKLSLKQTLLIIKKLITKNVSNKKFNYIFTHGSNGEYGHPRHLGVHQAVKQLIKEKNLQPQAIFYFNYKKTGQKEFSPLTARKNSDLILKLTKAEFAKKKKIMTDIYGFDANGIDANYCTNPEAFICRQQDK
ncbi:PIG-L family deacetylase [Candidatus Parcubacteria bacterium]|nr:PIG-L family deacetylase [Candidatus Parcubacteria bacterium]